MAAALADGPRRLEAAPRGPQRVALGLALVSVLLGLMPLASFHLVQIGRLVGERALP
jgi:hypothetical protein